MRSAIVKRSIVIAGHKTSVSLEDAFWAGLKDIAQSQRITLTTVIGELDAHRRHGNLSSTIRLFVLGHYRAGIASFSAERTATDLAPAPIAEGAHPVF